MQADHGNFDDAVEEGHANQPIVLRSFGKCPREYKTGEDFRAYIARFTMYCDLNNIPIPRRGPLLLTLLDNRAFDSAHNLQIEDLENFAQVREQLITRFDSPAGEIGNQFKLTNRKQMS